MIADNLVQFAFDRDCRIDVHRYIHSGDYYMTLRTDASGHWLWRLLSVTENSGNSPYLSYRAVVGINCVTEFNMRELKAFQKYWLAFIEICDYITSLRIPKAVIENGVFIDALKRAYKVRHKRLVI